MKRNRWTTRLLCGALILATLVVAVAAAGSQGTQDNPLVTLEYLNEKVLPEILEQVDRKVAERTKELEKTLEESQKAVFQSVEAGKDKTVTLAAGSQLLLRSGVAHCADGLIDLTTGEAVWGELSLNHLYIATGDKLKVTFSEKGSAMVQGSYTVK
ncbi:MAG: hypothetical protein HFF06_01025 [Oscillospiraceae bacterium]|nr:hypothetical protein [Oscillospiraceae bacterium]